MENNTNTTDDGTGEDGTEEVVVTWSAIMVTTAVALAQTVVFYSFFMYQRSKEKAQDSYALYEPRQFKRSHRSPPPFANSWWKAAWDVPQDELLRCVGLDSYMFLRFLRLGARMAAAGTIFSFLLIPVYATGDARGDATTEFNLLTLARVEQNGHRMWATALVWWLFVAFILHDLWTEWKLFAKNRYDFLASGDPDTPRDFRYAIQVEQLPPSLRSGEQLKEYFERIFPGKVRQATVHLEISDLQKLCDERQTKIEKLEGAVAFTHAKPDKPPPQVKVGGTMCFGGEKKDAIEYYTSEIERLNAEIDESRKAVLLTKNEKTEKIVEEQEPMGDDGNDSGVEIENIPDAAEQNRQLRESLSTSSGVVTFTSLRAKQAAVQCELSGQKDVVTAFPAADPEGIIWKNVTVPLQRQRILEYQAAAVWTAGILFWAVPVTFIMSISNLESILNELGIGNVNADSFVYGLVAGLLPVVALLVLMEVLYMAIVAVGTSWVRFKSLPEVDAYALKWHQLFQFANLWLILIGGSLFNQLDSILEGGDGEQNFIETIATALPGASVFFVNMMAIGGLGNFGLELSMLPAYGVNMILGLLQPEAQRTQRMLDNAKDTPNILWGQHIPKIVFVYMVSILYMSIVPLMELFAFVYFGGTYLVWKHQCLHVYSQSFEGGGRTTWLELFGFLMVCLYIGEGVFIAYMGIKESPGAAACGFVPLVVTILFHLAIRRNIIKPLENLSLQVAANIDIVEGELETAKDSSGEYDGDSVNYPNEQLYAQPALKTVDEERGPMPYRRSEEKATDEEVGNKVEAEEQEETNTATVY